MQIYCWLTGPTPNNELRIFFDRVLGLAVMAPVSQCQHFYRSTQQLKPFILHVLFLIVVPPPPELIPVLVSLLKVFFTRLESWETLIGNTYSMRGQSDRVLNTRP